MSAAEPDRASLQVVYSPIEQAEPEPTPAPEPAAPVVTAPEPGLLNDRERKRMDVAMAGLSRFGPIAELQRPAPRAEVDPLSSVSAADWSGMDGMGEPLASAPVLELAPKPVRREPTPAPVLEPVAASAISRPEPEPIPTTDPIKGWVTADRLFSDFGD